jgi:glycine/D-amino acid oxidase-like deaminating enzyme
VAHLGSTVLWHQTVGPRPPRDPARGDLSADVVVVGGGYTGLWTAYQLVRTDPTLDIVVLEAHDVAFGASGRNGGFAMTLLDFDLTRFAANWGDEAAAHAHRAVARSVLEMDRTVREEGIDADVEATGLLRVAANQAQLGRIEREHATADRLGLDGFRLLDREEVGKLLYSPSLVGGLLEDACLILNPAKLAVGLAQVVAARGVRVYEGAPVLDLTERPGGVVAVTPFARVTADTAVLATNAWAHRFPAARGWAVSLYTYVVVTEPLTDRQWDAIGWQGRQGVEDARNYVHYTRPTADGRILWGGSDAVYYYGGPISPRRDRHETIRRRLEREFLASFPQLGRVRFTHHWGGPISITSRFVPRIGRFDDGRIHYAFGYSGHGVAPAHTAGRVLRDLVLGRDTDDTNICFVDHPQPTFPPEPLTWIGAELSRHLLQRQDRRMDAGRDAGAVDPPIMRLLDRLP